jgi:UDP-glucose 4-epimerase
MGKRIFLTGISGYLGSVLAEHFSKSPEIETITGIDLAAPAGSLPPNVKFVKMDIRSPDLAAVMAGHDVVVHTAFIVQWLARMPAAVRDDINLNGIRNVAQAAVTNQVGRLIHTSSVAACDPHLVGGKMDVTEDIPVGTGASSMYYWNSKARAERILHEIIGPTQILTTLFRPCYIIGPLNRATVQGFRENAVNFPGHDPLAQFIHEEDVAAAFLQAICDDMPGAFNVVPDDYLRMSEVYKIIGVRSVPTIPLWLARLVTGFRWRFLGSPTHPSWVEATLIDCTLSNAKLKATGWMPHYNCAEAIRTAL